MAQYDEQNAGLAFFFLGGFQVFGGEARVFAETPNDGVVVRDAGFAFDRVNVTYRPQQGKPRLMGGEGVE